MSRNFRKQYYSSLGVQVVEVKPSLETAFQGDTLDVERLNKLCLWVRIPHSYRSLVWKVVLGALPLHKDVWPFIEEQRQEQYRDLKHAVKYLDPSQRNRDALTPEAMVRMLLIQLSDYSRREQTRRIAPTRTNVPDEMSPLLHLANTFHEICDVNEMDAYWLFAFFVRNFRVDTGICQKDADDEKSRIHADIAALRTLLKTHNSGLLSHMDVLNLDWEQCFFSWFQAYFSNVLPSYCLEGLWDIILGGAPAILPYIALSLLIACRRKLEGAKSAQDFIKLCRQIDKFVDLDAVASTAIDLWEKPLLESMSRDTRKALGL
ncbi:hypothetical protein HDU85_007414 [Gaertneriomyces sp. JEL0708]|nr:hypothetical protein HDU85_007414 [Gaertneriomyces sp. JEL0708]